MDLAALRWKQLTSTAVPNNGSILPVCQHLQMQLILMKSSALGCQWQWVALNLSFSQRICISVSTSGAGTGLK